LLDAYARAGQEGFAATDDAALLEKYGYHVRVVDGETSNIKITFREDLVMAEALLRMRGSTN
jgi:2-C-methyl-D-erythritol 4-phosphate cytidylyltransferase